MAKRFLLTVIEGEGDELKIEFDEKVFGVGLFAALAADVILAAAAKWKRPPSELMALITDELTGVGDAKERK